jgi:hypothetical protein
VSPIVTVPANLSSQLRNSLHNVLSESAKEIAAVADGAGREEHPERYRQPITRFKRTCALLDLVGWTTPNQPAAVQINLHEHGPALADALEMALLLADTDIEQLDRTADARAARRAPSNREATIARALALHEFTAAVQDTLTTLDGRGDVG